MRLVMIGALLPLAACGAMAKDEATSVKATRSFAVTDFSAVSLKGSDDVIVTVGPAFAVRAEGPAKALDELKITREGSALSVGRERSSSFSWGGGDREGVKVFVSMPRIAAANVAGSGDMRVDRVTGGDFAAAIAGSGDLAIESLQATAAKLSISGSGGIVARGAAQSLDMSITGSGDIDARAVKASRAQVSIAGSGDASADVTGPATVSIMGSGSAELGAGAKCTITKMGSGDTRCG